MKKQFTKLLFLFALLLTVSTSAWAETESTILTLDFSSVANASTSNSLTTETAATFLNSAAGLESGITCSAINTVYDGKGQGGDGIPQKCLKVGKAKGPGSITFTIPSSYDEVSKVEITGYGWKNTSSISINGGTAQTYSTAATEATKTFELSTASREIAIAVTTSAVCITEIKLIKVASSGTPTCATPTFSPAAGTYTVAQSVELSTTTEDATIHYTLDGSVPDASSTVYESAIAVNETTTIKAIAVKEGMNNSAVASATYTIVNLAHAGTAEDPYSVADAFTAIDAGVGLANVHVKGTISQVDSYNSTYHSITYWIFDEGTTANQLQVYSGKGIDGANFSSKEDLQVGDKVVVYGTLKKFNDIYEFDKNNELVSLVRPAAPVVASVTAEPAELDVDAAEHDGTIEVTYSNITDVTAEVQWFESDGSTPATCDWITAVINANNNIEYLIEENNTEAARTAYLKVYALDDNGEDVYSNLITINQAKALEQFTVTYYVAGEKFTTTRQEGAALNLPAPGARGGYQFAGWSTVEDAAAPKFVANDAAVNSALTLYAIFAKEVGETVYTKVTATEDITNGQYLIVYQDGNVAFNGALETLDAVGNTIEVEISDNTIASSEAVDAATFTIDTTAGTIQSASGLYIGRTEYNNGLETSASEQYTNTFSIDDEGNVVITAVVGNQNPTLRYNKASNQNRFRYYKSGQEAIQLYKQNQIAPATYTLNEPEATITAAANATWVAPAKVKITSDDVKVYTVTYDDAVGCTRKHEVADKVVPANGVVLLTSDDATTVTLENTTDEATDFAALDNDLQGSDGTVQGAANIFCLAVGEKGLGFYPVSNEIYVPAGKAYLLIPATQAAPSYLWFNGDTTAIDSLTTDTAAGNENGEIYSLTGQRVGKNYRGIVIMNGRKVLKK